VEAFQKKPTEIRTIVKPEQPKASQEIKDSPKSIVIGLSDEALEGVLGGMTAPIIGDLRRD
jgi:hypothetical protein